MLKPDSTIIGPYLLLKLTSSVQTIFCVGGSKSIALVIFILRIYEIKNEFYIFKKYINCVFYLKESK